MKNRRALKELAFKLFQRRIRKLLRQNIWREDKFSCRIGSAFVNDSNSADPNYAKS
jgi:hypothetical protein